MLRRRLVAVGVLLAAVIGVGFAIASVRGGSAKKPATTVSAAAPKPFRIIFPEGFTRDDMAARVQEVAKIARNERGKTPLLSKRAYLAATSGKRLIPGFGRRPLEGFLFPATYDFNARTPARRLVSNQVAAFLRNWRSVNLAYARSRNLTPYDVLTIASMIEKEAVSPDERGKVARVIYNRLHDGMKLGIDATIRYALHVPGTESLRVSQLTSPSPYNTRTHFGLPPTPISNPGLASIQAAAHPATGDWLYYVAAPDKVHSFFTSSYAEFEHYKATHGYK